MNNIIIYFLIGFLISYVVFLKKEINRIEELFYYLKKRCMDHDLKQLYGYRGYIDSAALQGIQQQYTQEQLKGKL